MRVRSSPTPSLARYLQQTGVSLLLASHCLFANVPHGCADPPPVAIETLTSERPLTELPGPAALQGLMSLEQVREVSALQEMGSLPNDDKVALRKISQVNSQLKDKGALKVLKVGQEIAARGADPETQMLDVDTLRQAEGRFTLLIEELAPTFAGGYSNRANVRVALKECMR